MKNSPVPGGGWRCGRAVIALQAKGSERLTLRTRRRVLQLLYQRRAAVVELIRSIERYQISPKLCQNSPMSAVGDQT